MQKTETKKISTIHFAFDLHAHENEVNTIAPPLKPLVADSSISSHEQLRQLLNTVTLVRRGDFSVGVSLTNEKES